MNLILAWSSVVILFTLSIYCLIKAKTWLNLKTQKEYRGFLIFVGVMFIMLISISTFVYVKLNPEVFEKKYITVTSGTEYNDIYKNNFSDFITSSEYNYSNDINFKNQSSSSEINKDSSSSSSSSSIS